MHFKILSHYTLYVQFFTFSWKNSALLTINKKSVKYLSSLFSLFSSTNLQLEVISSEFLVEKARSENSIIRLFLVSLREAPFIH